jgi:hypothetical protein
MAQAIAQAILTITLLALGILALETQSLQTSPFKIVNASERVKMKE